MSEKKSHHKYAEVKEGTILYVVRTAGQNMKTKSRHLSGHRVCVDGCGEKRTLSYSTTYLRGKITGWPSSWSKTARDAVAKILAEKLGDVKRPVEKVPEQEVKASPEIQEQDRSSMTDETSPAPTPPWPTTPPMDPGVGAVGLPDLDV